MKVLLKIGLFVVNKFLGKEWQRKQTELLVAKQEKKIAQLSKKIEKKFPPPTSSDDEIVL